MPQWLTYIVSRMVKKPCRPREKEQKDRKGHRGERNGVVEDRSDNGEEGQEEEVRNGQTTIKCIGRVTSTLTGVKEPVESIWWRENEQEKH